MADPVALPILGGQQKQLPWDQVAIGHPLRGIANSGIPGDSYERILLTPGTLCDQLATCLTDPSIDRVKRGIFVLQPEERIRVTARAAISDMDETAVDHTGYLLHDGPEGRFARAFAMCIRQALESETGKRFTNEQKEEFLLTIGEFKLDSPEWETFWRKMSAGLAGKSTSDQADGLKQALREYTDNALSFEPEQLIKAAAKVHELFGENLEELTKKPGKYAKVMVAEGYKAILKAFNQFKIPIRPCSASPLEVMRPLLQTLKIGEQLGLQKGVWNAEKIVPEGGDSGSIRYSGVPAKDAYQKLCEVDSDLKISNVVYFGDSHGDLGTALRAGIPVVFLKIERPWKATPEKRVQQMIKFHSEKTAMVEQYFAMQNFIGVSAGNEAKQCGGERDGVSLMLQALGGEGSDEEIEQFLTRLKILDAVDCFCIRQSEEAVIDKLLRDGGEDEVASALHMIAHATSNSIEFLQSMDHLQLKSLFMINLERFKAATVVKLSKLISNDDSDEWTKVGELDAKQLAKFLLDQVRPRCFEGDLLNEKSNAVTTLLQMADAEALLPRYSIPPLVVIVESWEQVEIVGKGALKLEVVSAEDA